MHPNAGDSPLDSRFFHKGMAVFDTVYNPAKTALCRQAEKAGCACQGGLAMLVYQALASCKYWIGRDLDEKIIDMAELTALVETPVQHSGADA
jgi:shikimate dehydrogenase